VSSIRHELAATRTARWYEAARNAQRSSAWDERVMCYAALSAILAEHRAAWAAGNRRSQPPIRRPGILTEVAHRAHFASAEPVYRRWRARQDGQPIVRWAGEDPAVKPSPAFVAEAKIVAFLPYREGVLQVADAFDMTLTEVAAAYLRAVAAWVADNTPLAACHPAGPPACVIEDMGVLAARIPPAGQVPSASGAARLAELACTVVHHVLQDTSITPLGAFNTVRDDVLRLLGEPSDSVADRVTHSVAELSDQLLHRVHGERIMTAGQARQILTALSGLSTLLSGIAEGPASAELPR
jgi:hypothetical protein